MSGSPAGPRLGARFVAAVGYAAECHADQTRKGTSTPYIAHLLAVASLVLEDGGDEDEAIAALLHDAAEDQGGESTLAEIRERFGPRVAGIVEALSDSLAEDGGEKEEWGARKRRHLAHLREEGDAAILRVGLSDKLHNIRSIVRDHRLHGDALWERFRVGPASQLWYYGDLVDVFEAAPIESPMVGELRAAVDELRRATGTDADPPG